MLSLNCKNNVYGKETVLQNKSEKLIKIKQQQLKCVVSQNNIRIEQSSA